MSKQKKTYDVIFTSFTDKQNLGFYQSKYYCMKFIFESLTIENSKYYKKFVDGVVSILCNESGEIIWNYKIR